MPPRSFAEYPRPACAPQLGFRSPAAPPHEPRVLAGATPAQAAPRHDDVTARWRARSRTLSPEPLAVAPAVDWSWTAADARSALQSRAGREERGEQAPEKTGRDMRRSWPRSPSPRYGSSSRDSESPVGRRWEQPLATQPLPPWCGPPRPRDVRYSRSPSPPCRSRSPRPAAPAYEAPPRPGIRPPLRAAAANECTAPRPASPAAGRAPISRAAPVREMPAMRHGRVVRFVAKSRYGFIVDVDDKAAPDFFVNNASLALGCRDADTLRVGTLVTFRSDSRLVNGVMKQYAYDVAPADAPAVRTAHAHEKAPPRGGSAAQHQWSPENAPPHVRGGGRPCAPRR